MRISEQWLREWVDFPETTQELAHRLTMAGLEVDAIEPAAPAFSGVGVGEIVSCQPHPDATTLTLCEVSAGERETRAVVCGAPNVRVGLKAPFATVGAVLPGSVSIRATEVRGVPSQGMLCSARELGLSEDAAGLMALPANAPIGVDLRHYLGLDDTVIEVDLTPNRSDCLGMAGIAREVAALTRLEVTPPIGETVAPALDHRLPIELQAPADCPRYVGRVVRGIDARAESPVWLRERLRRAGVRPLAVAVDVTNYVMLELGQPMHAFDLARLEGGIRVRRADAGESLELLNGETIELDSHALVIADHAGPVALAGVMGGEQSAVSPDTHDVFLEAAFFAPQAVAGRSRIYGLHSDSAHRFERGVDPALAPRAMERATGLLCAIAGGEPGPVLEAVEASALPEQPVVALRPERVNALLGASIPEAAMADILQRLGLSVADTDGVWSVHVPTWRFDIAREVDLIEEIARVWGYDDLPTKRTPVALAMDARSERQLSVRRLSSALVDRGYQEAIAYSFVSPELQDYLDPETEPVALANPISAELAVMRTSLWTGLVRAALYNQNRQHTRIRLFETGLRFRGTLSDLHQEATVAAIACGAAVPEQWGEPGRDTDFYDLKADVEALLALTGEPERFRFAAEPHPALHPGQSARVYRGDSAIGWLGALHPRVEEALGLLGRTYVFELELAPLREAALLAFRPLSRFPSIRRDLALVVDEAVTAERVRSTIVAAAGEQLRDVVLFDVYRGRGVPNGCKSVAIGLILQDSSRTLTDEDVELSIARVVGRLKQDLNATLRE